MKSTLRPLFWELISKHLVLALVLVTVASCASPATPRVTVTGVDDPGSVSTPGGGADTATAVPPATQIPAPGPGTDTATAVPPATRTPAATLVATATPAGQATQAPLSSTPPEPTAPQRGPDDRFIGFLCEHAHKEQPFFTYQVAVISVDGTKHRLLYDLGSQMAHGPYWSPDGSKILFEVEGVAFILDPLDPEGGVVTAHGGFPSWMPGSEHILVRKVGSDGGSYLAAVDLQGTVALEYPTPLAHVGIVTLSAMSPDSKAIAYITSEYPNGLEGGVVYNAYVLDTVSGDSKPLTDFPIGTNVSWKSPWFPGGDRILIEYDGSTAGRDQAAIVSVADAALLQIGTLDRPRLSPDGSRILFVRDPGLWVAGVDGSDRTSIAPGTIEGSWTPDSQAIVTGGGGGITLTAVDGGETTRIPVAFCDRVSDNWDPPFMQP